MDKDPEASIYLNPHALSSSTNINAPPSSKAILDFHRSLPKYVPTSLIPLSSDLFPSIKVDAINTWPKVYLKLESPRLDLPSFKILGASHAIHHLLCNLLSLRLSTPLSSLGPPAQDVKLTLVTASEGNWGRAVAHTAALLTLPCTVYVPSYMDTGTRGRIESEGPTVHCVDVEGDYDHALSRVKSHAAEDKKALMVLDTSFDDYVQFPQWVTEGYETSMAEVDAQLPQGVRVTHAFAAVGVGSWAHGVVSHYKGHPQSSIPGQADNTKAAKIVSVEPTTAACLRTSLLANKITVIKTGHTIMCGMNCGTVSSLAWPVLRDGVDTSVTVSDWEAHVAVEDLKRVHGLEVGPCGAAMLSALRRVLSDNEGTAERLGLNGDSLVVLYATEGARPYETPAKE